jgi:hypothetical protein
MRKIGEKDIEKFLNENDISGEEFDNLNLSYDDMVQMLTDFKGYIRKKLNISEKESTQKVKTIEIDKDVIKEIAEEIEKEMHVENN